MLDTWRKTKPKRQGKIIISFEKIKHLGRTLKIMKRTCSNCGCDLTK